MAEKTAVYKIFNGNEWETIYFKTRADQVLGAQYTSNGSTYYQIVLDTKYHTVNGKNFGNQSGIVLTDSDINYTGDSDILGIGDEDIQNGDSLNSVITKIAGAIQIKDGDLAAIAAITKTSGFLKKTAADTWDLDTTVLTSGNYSSTLGNVYEAKFTDGSATIASVSNDIVTLKAGVNQTNGAIGNSTGTDIALAKVAKTGAFSDLSGTGNIVTSSNNLTTDKIILGNANNKTVKASNYSVDDIVSIAEGKTKTYTTTLVNGSIYVGNTASSGSSTLPTGAIAKGVTGSTNVIEIDRSTYTYWYRYIDGVYVSIAFTDMHAGDNILITQTDVPDFWYSGTTSGTGIIYFYKLETTKVDLSSYALANHTHTTTLATDTGTSTITLAHGGKYKLTAGGTSVIFTMPTDNNTDTWREIKVAGESKIGSTTSTALDFLNTGNVTFFYNNGLIANVDLSGYATTSSLSNYVSTSSANYIKSASVSGRTLTLTKGDNSTVAFTGNKVFYGTTTPTGMATNDIWIDTTA